MIFTRQQIEEIHRRLGELGVRDTDIDKLDLKTYPLDGNETIVIVKEDENVRISLEDLFTYLISDDDKSGFMKRIEELFNEFIEDISSAEDIWNVWVLGSKLPIVLS